MPAMATAPVELLKKVPMFAKLSDRELKRLSETFTERPFTAGQELTAEGQGAAGFFIIESGEAAVTVDGEARRTLGSGDYFGEIALIDGGRRTATITATADGRSWGLTQWQFKPLVEDNATIAWPLLEAMAARVRELDQHSHG
jgi:CRP/FNR family transcriptional regulator, cyclic AMP receptor protein